MVSPDCQSLSKALLLNILMIGFPETEIAPSGHSVLPSLEAQPVIKWISTIQDALDQIALGHLFDVIILDCRKDEEVWEQVSQVQQEGVKAVIFGIMSASKTETTQAQIVEDAIGYRVDESLTPTVLKWIIHHVQERKQLLFDRELLRCQLGEASYKVEMADVASTVLHNVGNVLTSVMVAANMVESVVDQSSVTLVTRVAELLKAHDEDLGRYVTEDPKGKRISPSLQKLGIHLIDEQQTVLKEMQGLVKNIHHMKQIIASHQTMAKSAGQAEQVALVDVLSHAMELSFQPGDTEWITIRRDYQEVPSVLVDQHQLLQILVNLLRNAKQAMRQQSRDCHELHLRMSYQRRDEACVVMTIQDSGIGIAPEHLSKMFTRGFTTKEDGNGIGLHSSILAIQNMGGSMHVESEGVGYGATFTLTFPVP